LKKFDKKICIVGPATPLRGGNALFVAHLVDALKHDFYLRVISFKRLYPKLLFPGKRQKDISREKIRSHPSEPILDCLSPFSWSRAVQRIGQIKPDMVIITWWQPFFGFLVAYIAGNIKRRFKIPIFIITENVISHEARFIDRFLTRIALRKADGFLSLSQVVDTEISRLYPYKPRWRAELPVYDCYALDDTDMTKAKKELKLDGKELLLFFGYVREYKGLDILLESLALIKVNHPDIHLLIVGEFYEKEEKYWELIRNLDLRTNVTVINQYVPNEDVGKYYTAADLVVLPYRSATQSGILQIAFGFDRPVLVTRVGGLDESVQNDINGYVVPPKDPGAIAEKCLDFFEKKRFADFQKGMRELKEKNRFSSMVSIVNSAFEKLLP